MSRQGRCPTRAGVPPGHAADTHAELMGRGWRCRAGSDTYFCQVGPSSRALSPLTPSVTPQGHCLPPTQLCPCPDPSRASSAWCSWVIAAHFMPTRSYFHTQLRASRPFPTPGRTWDAAPPLCLPGNAGKPYHLTRGSPPLQSCCDCPGLAPFPGHCPLRHWSLCLPASL